MEHIRGETKCDMPQCVAARELIENGIKQFMVTKPGEIGSDDVDDVFVWPKDQFDEI